jgi:hypothetical protein
VPLDVESDFVSDFESDFASDFPVEPDPVLLFSASTAFFRASEG